MKNLQRMSLVALAVLCGVSGCIVDPGWGHRGRSEDVGVSRDHERDRSDRDRSERDCGDRRGDDGRCRDGRDNVR